MSNLNIQIDLTKIPGAREMDIQGNKSTRRCVVIPIDNALGIVCNGYPSRTKEGLPTERFFADVKLNVVAIEYRQPRFGITHGLKPAYSKEVLERMTEEQVHNTPWCGTVKPWNLESKTADDTGDLPAADDNDPNNW